MSGEALAPVRLKKITTRYHQVEDRIRMDAQVDGGGTQSFWLTHRFCRQLVRTLVGYFNQSGLSRSDPSPHSQGTVQRFFHQSARAGKKKTTPVVLRRRAEALLLDRVQVRTTDKAVQLLLPLPDERKGVLIFSPNEARQWLDILYQQYQAAEWALDIWPDWIRDGEQAGTAAGNSVDGSVH